MFFANTFNKLSCIAFLFVLVSFICSCNQPKKNKSHRDIPDSSIAKGKILAAQWCQSCHLLPDPSILDAKSWEKGVLPAMGPHLGIFSYGFERYPSSRNDKHLPANYYPSTPVLNNIEWQNIIDYYTSVAPDSLSTHQHTDAIKPGQKIFKVQYPEYIYPSPAVCFSKFDTSGPLPKLLVFDLSEKYMFRFNNRLQLTDSVKSDATITDVDFYENTMLACNIEFINPNNGKLGKAHFVHTDLRGKLRVDSVPLFDSLARPVQIVSGDLNSDKKTDYLVCEFGNSIGALSWMENTGEAKYIRHVLRAEPGAIKGYIEDVNHDGLMDIWALFSQGDEGIFLFKNKGKGKFEQKQVLRFPAVFGSTYFEFADFNSDGLQDIIYTCGDNADYSPVLKPYHGVYIFLNEGNDHFSQKYFFPINGCYKAMARDYDGDGDLDIATIAFFADYRAEPEEGFVYLENKGNFKFEPFTMPECKTGRWLTMDAGDLDGDGKIDIVLGNFSIRPSIITPLFDWRKGPPFILLKNISK